MPQKKIIAILEQKGFYHMNGPNDGDEQKGFGGNKERLEQHPRRAPTTDISAAAESTEPSVSFATMDSEVPALPNAMDSEVPALLNAELPSLETEATGPTDTEILMKLRCVWKPSDDVTRSMLAGIIGVCNHICIDHLIAHLCNAVIRNMDTPSKVILLEVMVELEKELVK